MNTQNHDKNNDSYSNSTQDMGEDAVPRKSSPSKHMSLENIDLEAPNTEETLEISQSKNTDSLHLTESDVSEGKDEVSENLRSCDASVNDERKCDQQNGEDVLTDLKTTNLQSFSDMSKVIVFLKSETVSNPNTSTPTSKNILPSFSSFIKGSAKSQPRRMSTSDMDSKNFPKASSRRCASQESTSTKTVKLHRIRRRSKSESNVNQKPDSLCGMITAFPCPTEVSRPIMTSQREVMKRKAQREREQAARVTNLGLDRNVLANREHYPLEIYPLSVHYSISISEHMSLGNIDLEAHNDSFHLTESDVSEGKDEVSENLRSCDASLNNERESDQQNGEDVLTDLDH
ncbi:uncharacterized protein LOC128621379 isoform X2 [Ictalurus furcatus]|uniref:uncharacterized protein LOC128621379 isoform X2 n=1 Tax=Ictalurus furcatus TaxID=66913 RepID=UPI002350E524|nr:uncharacterized protein LOC128621379 isoform X2 [Ictalurus furcatus]